MALGKGLSALIPEKATDQLTEDKLVQSQTISSEDYEISVAMIQDNQFQPRQNYDESKLAELASSIKEKGFLQPIVVRRKSDGYEVVAGERRLKAARLLGLDKVPVVIRDVSDKEALVLALVENLQREELNPIEKAESYRRLIDEFQYTQETIASSVGKDRATIANVLRILKLPLEIRTAIAEEQITEGHARALLSVDDPNAQKILFIETIQKKLSVRDLENRAKTIKDGVVDKKKKVFFNPDPELAALEGELRRIFGTKVAINHKRSHKGKISIEYYSLDDFDRILSVFRKQ